MKLEDLYFLAGKLKPKILSLECEFYEFLEQLAL